jgi:hypothetical protein
MDRLQPKFITFKLISDIVWQAASSNIADLKSSYTDVVTTVIYSNGKRGRIVIKHKLQIQRKKDHFYAYLA